MPFALKLKGRSGKHILKQTMGPRLPSQIAGRGKKGFGLPVAKWLHGPWRELLLETLGNGRRGEDRLARPAGCGWHDRRSPLRSARSSQASLDAADVSVVGRRGLWPGRPGMRTLLALLTAGLVVGCTPGRGAGAEARRTTTTRLRMTTTPRTTTTRLRMTTTPRTTTTRLRMTTTPRTMTTPAATPGPTSQAPAGYAGTGGAVGDFAYDMAVMDQFGSSATLTQFYGAFVLVQFCSVWAGPLPRRERGSASAARLGRGVFFRPGSSSW